MGWRQVRLWGIVVGVGWEIVEESCRPGHQRGPEEDSEVADVRERRMLVWGHVRSPVSMPPPHTSLLPLAPSIPTFSLLRSSLRIQRIALVLVNEAFAYHRNRRRPEEGGLAGVVGEGLTKNSCFYVAVWKIRTNEPDLIRSITRPAPPTPLDDTVTSHPPGAHVVSASVKTDVKERMSQ
ncbi:hypothetical protein BDQ17DRAFT_1441648 [Cyathus striatus]|nr:hypothetical protein BDQ17DRAFT_1441648 [Cyathus striatus]